MFEENQLVCLFVLKGSALNRGMNTGLENLAWGLAEKGVVVHILAGGEEPLSHGYRIHSNVHYWFTGKYDDNPLSFAPVFQELLQKFKIDVVLGWIAIIAPLAGVPNTNAISFIAIEVQMTRRLILLRLLKRAILKRGIFSNMLFFDALKYLVSIYKFPGLCKAVVSNSETVQKSIIPAYGVRTDKCRVIRGGIDTDIYRFEKKSSSIDGCSVLFAGNIHEPKGVSELVSALEFISTPITLTLCGKGNQSYVDGLCDRVKSYKLGHTLVYAGIQNQEQMIKYYHECDIFAFPSHSEGMPKALLEAMACGCAVICSDIGPHREVVQNGNNGLIAPVRSVRGIANGLKKYIDNPGLREICAIGARKTVEEHFSARHEIDNWLELFAIK